jgi:hypothetical protein
VHGYRERLGPGRGARADRGSERRDRDSGDHDDGAEKNQAGKGETAKNVHDYLSRSSKVAGYQPQ